MKLSNQQVSALANKICREVLDPINEYNDSLRNSEEYKNFIKEDKDCKKLQEIADKYPNESKRYRSCVSDNIYSAQIEIKELYFDSKFKKRPNISIDMIEQEIILGTIDCEGLDDLIAKIKDKFSK